MRVLGVVGERASERTGARPRSRDRGRGDRWGSAPRQLAKDARLE